VDPVDGGQFVGGTLVVRSGGSGVISIGALDVASGVRKGFETGVVAGEQESGAQDVRMFWNEDQVRLMIQRPKGIAAVINIHDAAGRVVYTSGSAGRSIEETIQLDMLRPGSYVATSTTAMGEVTFMRFVKAGW